MILNKSEQETHFNQTGVDRMGDTVYVATCDPVWIARLEKMGFVGKPIGTFGTKEFVCENCTMNIRRRTSSNMSDEQRKAAGERLRIAREKKNATK